nr:uncharacterized mitochondrial protein AtMg00810-like [Tanacetum cinerariifolium]
MLKDMDQDSAYMVVASKVSMLKPGEFEIWRMRIEQYIQMIDNALWEVKENGATLPKTQVVEGVMTEMPITSAEEKPQRRLDMKARRTLMMGISNEHQLKFNSIKDAKKLLEAIEKRFGGNAATKKNKRNLLKQQYENFTAPSSEMLDQTFDRLQKLVFNTAQVVNTAHGVSTTSTQVNAAYSTNIDNLSDAVICSLFGSQPNSPQLAHEDLKQIHPDDIEEMNLRWQIAMLTIRARKFLKKIRRKLTVNGNETIGFNKSKVKCYNCHKKRHFTMECRTLRNLDNKHKESSKRSVPVEITNSTALVSCDDKFVSKPVSKIYKAKSSGKEPKVVKKDNYAPIIEEWVSDNKEKEVSQPKIEKKIFKPSIAKIERPIHKNTAFKNSNVNQRVNIVKGKNVNTARPKAVINVVKGNNLNAIKASACWVWKPETRVLDHVFKHNSASITLKKFDYIDAQGRSNLLKKMYCLVVTDDYSKFTWVFFLATKDETSGILKSFITRIENLVDPKVKVTRCDNETEFKNREMNQFCEMKGIMRQFSVARTPQQNRVAERRNRILIEAARTMLADSKLPTTFWVEEVNITCYVQNKVLVVKPHNNTLYELFHKRTQTICFMRPFGCAVTILNIIDHLSKFNGTQSNDFASTKASNNAGQARKETEPVKYYIWLSLWTTDPLFSQDPKSSHDDGFKPSSDDGKKVDEDPSKENERNDQEKEDNVNSTNNVNTVSLTVNVTGTNKDNELPFDPNMHALEDVSTFKFSSDDEDDGTMANMNKLDTTIQVIPILTIRIHKDHPLDQLIRNLQSAIQTRKMSKNLEEHGFVSSIHQRTNHKDLQNYLFAYFLSQEDPKKVIHALKDPSWIEAMQEELLQFKLKKGCMYVNHQDLKIQTFLIEYKRLKKHCIDYIKLLVYVDDIIFGSTRKELCNAFERLMHEKFQMNFMGELTFFLGLQVKQKKDGIFISQDKYVAKILKKFRFTEVKAASTPMETQKPLLKDKDGEEVDVHMYMLMIGSLMYLTSSRPDIIFVVCACARYQVNLKVSHLYAVKRIFSYLKGQPKLGLWYPKDSPFDLIAYTNSDFAGANSDIKSTIGGKAKNSVRLVMEKLFGMELELILLFWSTAMAKTINGEAQLQARVDGKEIIITEASIRRDLQLADEEGVYCLPNSTIFEQLALMGTMASAIICLATNQKFNFSKWIFDNMIRNLDNVSGKFLMYSRFVQVFLDKHIDGMSNHERKHISPSHTKKIFGNIRRAGKGFSGRVTPLFLIMMVQSKLGEGSAMPTDPHYTPTILQSSSSQPQKTHKPRKPTRKVTQ